MFNTVSFRYRGEHTVQYTMQKARNARDTVKKQCIIEVTRRTVRTVFRRRLWVLRYICIIDITRRTVRTVFRRRLWVLRYINLRIIGATMKKDSAGFHQKAGDIQKSELLIYVHCTAVLYYGTKMDGLWTAMYFLYY